MNKHLHHIIFNAKRGQRMAELELVMGRAISAGELFRLGFQLTVPAQLVSQGLRFNQLIELVTRGK